MYFPDIERVEWLNRILKQVWPNVNHYARDLIRDQIQPNLAKNLEKFKLNGFKFERMILGDVVRTVKFTYLIKYIQNVCCFSHQELEG